MAAPTIVKFEQYPSGQLPKLPYIMGAGFANSRFINSTFQWNASGSGTNEYYLTLSGGGDPTATLTSNSILNPKFRFEQNGSATNNEMVWCDEGTAGSLAAYEFDYADNDSLGFSTWYVRLPSGVAPPLSTSVVEWDESTTGDGSDAQDCLIQWRCNSHPVGWTDKYRMFRDEKWDNDIDWSEETWSSTKTSRIQSPSISAVLEVAGDYEFEVSVTNLAGDTTTATFSITVNAESRTQYTVNSAGGADYTTLNAAIAAGRQLISIAGGHTETTPSGAGINWAGLDNVTIEWDGASTKPNFTRTAAAGQFFALTQVYGCTVYGIDSTATGTTNLSTQVFRLRETRNIAIVSCRTRAGATPATDRIGFFVKHNGVAEVERNSGTLIQNCGSDTDTYDDYWLAPDSYPTPINHVHLLGNYVVGSPTEQAIRLNANYCNVGIVGCYIGEDGNDSIRIGDCNMLTMHNCVCPGTIHVSGFVARPIRPYRVRISAPLGVRGSSGLPLAQISLDEGAKDTTIVNAVVDLVNDANGAGSGNTDPATVVSASNPFLGYWSIEGNKLVCCAVIKRTGTADGFVGATGTYVSDNIVKGCMVHTPDDSTWSGTDYDLGAFTGENNDAAADYQLDADYVPTGATALTRYPEAIDDFWGNLRSATTVRGVAEYGPAGPPEFGGSALSVPINANLDLITLPTAANSQLLKVLVVHDSQGLRQANRWVGQTPKWDIQHVGAFCGSIIQQSAGTYYSEVSGSAYGATITTTRMDDTDDWGDGNTSDHISWGNKWSVAGTINPNFSELGRYAIYDNGTVYTRAFDKDTRKNARVILRDQSGGFARMRVSEYRSTTTNLSDDFGLAGDPVEFDGSGALRILNWPIRAAGTLGTAGGNPVGVIIRDSNNLDTNRHLNILGTLIYNSPTGEDFPSSGMVLANTGHAGWSAYDHVNRQSSAVKTALIAAMEGIDLIIVMLGHNAEDSGTYSDNIQALITEWNTRHTGQGYGNPDYLLIAPWKLDGSSAWTESKVNDLYAIAKAGGHGFISLWHSYGGQNPDGRTEQLDGTSTTYTMDGIVTDNPHHIHPNDSTTATAIAQDIEWHFDEANWVPATTGGLGIRDLSRNRSGLRLR